MCVNICVCECVLVYMSVCTWVVFVSVTYWFASRVWWWCVPCMVTSCMFTTSVGFHETSHYAEGQGNEGDFWLLPAGGFVSSPSRSWNAASKSLLAEPSLGEARIRHPPRRTWGHVTAASGSTRPALGFSPQENESLIGLQWLTHFVCGELSLSNRWGLCHGVPVWP